MSSGKRRTKKARGVADAASRLFASQGYSAVSLATIAEAAGAHVQTVYTAFGSKPAVLAAALSAAVAGDQDMDVPPEEWPWAKALIDDPNPVGKLRRLAAHRRELTPPRRTSSSRST